MTAEEISDALHRRIAFLESERERPDLSAKARRFVARESVALQWLMSKVGMLDVEQVRRRTRAVRERVQPLLAERRRDRDRGRAALSTPPPPPDSGRDVRADAELLVLNVVRATRVA